MDYEAIKRVVERSTSTTLMANAFRKACGLPLRYDRRVIYREERVDYKKLMSQRYGVLIR